MSLTTDHFREFMTPDPEDDENAPFGDALIELSVDVDVDAEEEGLDGCVRL